MLSPTISIIVCHHTGDFIYGCVKSIKESFSADYEIIIMSSDPSLQIEGCRIFYSTDTPAKKRNDGAYHALGEFLCFLDDDVTITPMCLYQLHKTFKRLNVGMVFSKLWNMQYRNRLDDAGSFLTWTGFLWSRAGQLDEDKGQYNRPCYVLAGKSACCMIKKDLFHKVGKFDEDFGILGEETDLAWRIWLIGKDVYYQPKATGYHAFNTDFKPKNKHYTTERVQYNGCRNYITMLIKNLEADNLWKILPIHIAIWSSVGLAMIITGKFRQGLAVWRGIGYVITNICHIFSKRNSVQSFRILPDSELFHFIKSKFPKRYAINRVLRYLRIGLHG